jgi:hypothetical protein
MRTDCARNCLLAGLTAAQAPGDHSDAASGEQHLLKYQLFGPQCLSHTWLVDLQMDSTLGRS